MPQETKLKVVASGGLRGLADSPVQYLTRVLPYLRPYRKLAFLLVVCTVLVSLVGLLSPWPLKVVIDHVLESQPAPPVLAYFLSWADQSPLTLLLLAVGAGLLITLGEHGLSVAISHVKTQIQQSMVLDVRSDLFQYEVETARNAAA